MYISIPFPIVEPGIGTLAINFLTFIIRYFSSLYETMQSWEFGTGLCQKFFSDNIKGRSLNSFSGYSLYPNHNLGFHSAGRKSHPGWKES